MRWRIIKQKQHKTVYRDFKFSVAKKANRSHVAVLHDLEEKLFYKVKILVTSNITFLYPWKKVGPKGFSVEPRLFTTGFPHEPNAFCTISHLTVKMASRK